MIKKPQELTATGKKFSMIIYGEPGIGKTTIALSAPNPVLCDFDRGVLRVRAEHRSTTVEVSNYDEFLGDLESPEIQQCETIVIDTAGSMVSLMYSKYDKELNTRDPRKVYGAIKSEFSRLTGQIRDVMNKNVIYIFHSVEEQKNEKTVVRLLCEGSAKNLVWAPCDFGGFMYRSKNKRYIGFTSTDEAFAKGCHGISGEHLIPELNPGDKNDFVTRLLDQARANIEADDANNNALKSQYDDVMLRGMQIITAIVDAETANTAMNELLQIEHISTSKKELSALLKKKTTSLKLDFNKDIGEYVAAKGAA
jgi:hypothetical protein